MSSGAVCGAWLCLSQTIVLFSLMALNCCLLDQWSHLGQLWYLGPFSPMPHDPWLYFWNSFSRSISCAHDAKCVPVQYGGRYLCLGLSPLANQPPPPLLTCFLSLLLFTSCCLMEASRAKQKFSCRSQEPQAYIRVSLALFLRRDAWAFWPLFSGGSESPASSPHVPLGSQMFQKVDVTGSLITNYLANTVYENPIPLAAQL